jgi:hypothetical protein
MASQVELAGMSERKRRALERAAEYGMPGRGG